MITLDSSGELALGLDPGTGLPVALASMPLLLSATAVTEGREVHLPLRGIGYEDTIDLTDFKVAGEPVRLREDVYAVVTVAGDWTVTWEYAFRPAHPRLAIAVEVSGPGTLRDLRIEIACPDTGGWRVDAPGNELRPGLWVADLTEAVPVSTAGGFMGSTGLIAVHDGPRTLVVWPICRTEIGSCSILGTDGLQVRLDTGVAGRLAAGESLRYDAIHLDILDLTWEQARSMIPSWYRDLGISTPADHPDWVETATIYEVQIGTVVRSGAGTPTSRTPTCRAAARPISTASQSLGFSVLQLMPRQPFPSYNVLDYDGHLHHATATRPQIRDAGGRLPTTGVCRSILDVLHARRHRRRVRRCGAGGHPAGPLQRPGCAAAHRPRARRTSLGRDSTN